MSELKPCPFCASPVKHIPGHTIAEPIGQISCLLCAICMDGFYYSSVEDLISAWNRRADTPALLRGARIGLEMAAKKMADGNYADKEHERSCEQLADIIRVITDADIEKEISRE